VRSDIAGDKISKALVGFFDDLAPFSQKKLKKTLHAEFGDNLKETFLEFDFAAVASASIAQVHKAKLQDGSIVAVKVLRPKIAKIVARDIASLKLLAFLTSPFSKFFKKFLRDISLLLEQVSKYELDLLSEASNASKLREDLKGVKGFYVPEIFWQFSSQKILVLEWLDGIAFSDHEAIQRSPFDKAKIADNLVISYFNQVYSNGFFHADMHPGNLFLLKNGDIGVVDFGIMGKIDKKTRLGVAEILIGFLSRDYNRVAQIHIDIGLVPEDTKIDDLALSCRRIGETIVGSDVKDIPVAKILSGLIAMTRDYKMDTRPELLLLQKTVLLVEGVGVMLDPKLNIWNLARPWIGEWATKNIGFDAKIRDAVVDFIDVVRKFVRRG
jgi:ubiquinone biosynthesis protein